MRTPRMEIGTSFEKFLASGPPSQSPDSPERPGSVRSGHSSLRGARVVAELPPASLRLPYRKPEKMPVDNVGGSGCGIVSAAPPAGIRTFPQKNHVDGSGAIVISEPETKLMAHFEPSCMENSKTCVREEPKWVFLERRRHFPEDKHLEGPSASVVAEPEKRLLCSLGGFRDFPVGARKWFPDWDHLEGAGVDEIVDVELGADDPHHWHQDGIHRIQFPEKDHLCGAGVYEVLELTPRKREGKQMDDHNQKSGIDGKWWLSSWHEAKTAFKGSPPKAPIPDPSLRAAGLNFTSHCPGESLADENVPRRRSARTPPRSLTPRSETPCRPEQARSTPPSATPRSETPQRWEYPRGSTPRSETPRSEIPRYVEQVRSITPRSETPRSEVSRSIQQGRGERAWSTPRSSGWSCR